ncbi:MAG: HD domain-containing protein [Gammaproteobacteria bacterium]|nr:HD domain-containing protein [Gammaproteobacteria bacterium]
MGDQAPLRAALAAGDRQALQSLLTPTFTDLSRHHGLQRLSLIGPDRRVLLRFHAPVHHGDRIKTALLEQAEVTGRPATGIGFGFGERGHLALRTILPLHEQGTQLGYLLVGEDMGHLLGHLDDLFQLHHLLLIERPYLERHAIDLGEVADETAFPRHRLTARSAKSIPAPLRQRIVTGELAGLERGELLSDNGNRYFVGAIPLRDPAGELLGRIVTLRDISAAHQAFGETLILINGLTAVLVILLLGFLYHITTRAERRMETAYHELETSHHQLERAKREWSDAFDAIAEPIFLHDHKFRIVRANRAYAELAGEPFQALIGRPYWEAFPRGDGPLPGCGSAIRDIELYTAREEQQEHFTTADGRHFTSRSFYTRHTDGSFRYSVHILSDQTELEQLAENLRHEVRARRIISGSNQALIHAENEPQLLQRICDLIADEAELPLAWIGYREDDPERTLRVVASAGIEEVDTELLGLTWADTEQGQNPAARAIRSGELLLVRDIERDTTCEACQALARKIGYRSVLVFPLEAKGRTFGALALAGIEADTFSEEEITLLHELADDLAFGVVALRSNAEREQAEARQLELLQQLETSLNKTVEAMAIAVEARDPYTAGHQRHVAELATAIAGEMNLTEAQREAVRIAATIHDVGKIYVPAEILSKPGRLSEMEFALIKSHPQVGYDILKDIDFPWPVAEMVYQHHERLDGSGYPRGLKDSEILLEARIIAVADVVEAMAAHRPYRPSRGIDEVLAELAEGRDSRYDPEVVDACTRLFRDKGFKFITN